MTRTFVCFVVLASAAVACGESAFSSSPDSSP